MVKAKFSRLSRVRLAAGDLPGGCGDAGGMIEDEYDDQVLAAAFESQARLAVCGSAAGRRRGQDRRARARRRMAGGCAGIALVLGGVLARCPPSRTSPTGRALSRRLPAPGVPRQAPVQRPPQAPRPAQAGSRGIVESIGPIRLKSPLTAAPACSTTGGCQLRSEVGLSIGRLEKLQIWHRGNGVYDVIAVLSTVDLKRVRALGSAPGMRGAFVSAPGGRPYLLVCCQRSQSVPLLRGVTADRARGLYAVLTANGTAPRPVPSG